jgi:NAD-dependent deacetylase
MRILRSGPRPPRWRAIRTDVGEPTARSLASPRPAAAAAPNRGSLSRVRCTDERCRARAPAPDPADSGESPPSCPRCFAPMRYDMVLFDEPLSPADERRAKEALRSTDVFLAAGTSGVGFPAAACVREAEYAGARTLLVNLEPPSPPNPYFHEVVLGRAEEILPALLRHAPAPLGV